MSQQLKDLEATQDQCKIICPCEDCICLPMCKNRVNNGNICSLITLSDMCDRFQAFMFPQKDVYISMEYYHETIQIRGSSVQIPMRPPAYKVNATASSQRYMEICIKLLNNNLLKNINFNRNFDYSKSKGSLR